jgi:hypothetical protein
LRFRHYFRADARAPLPAALSLVATKLIERHRSQKIGVVCNAALREFATSRGINLH